MSRGQFERDRECTGATLAPGWHTAVLIALILSVAFTGSLLGLSRADGEAQGAPLLPPGTRIWLQYLPLILVNVGLVLYTARLFRTASVLGELLGHGFQSPRRVATDLVLAAACFALICLLEFSFQKLFVAGHNAAIAPVLPSTGAERLTWLVVAPCVGFCEEVVYRGYLQTQLTACTRSAVLGILFQAVLFGLAHLDRGESFAARAALYGALFGALARARRSLWPGIACHASLDLVGALLR